MKPMTEAHLEILRRHMVEVIDMHFDLAEEEIGRSGLSADLRRALMKVPRHLFVPQPLAAAAYQDTPLPIGFDKTLSQPFRRAPSRPRSTAARRPRQAGSPCARRAPTARSAGRAARPRRR